MRITAFVLALLAAVVAHAAPGEYFAIKVVDEQTGRGVPLVELKTTSDIKYVTDSNGLAAFVEPGLMGTEVFFYVSSHGYEFPKDAFGYAGVRLKPTAGGETTVKIKRNNIAERLYRVTGGGIYRDTVLLGRKAPIKEPVINGLVLGQDSILTCEYRGKMWWFWGDTNKPGYPLGLFHMSGATSALPGKGALDPSAGVDLTYFVGKDGFSRDMFPAKEEGPIWADAFMVLPDEKGRERFICHFTRVRGLEGALEQGLGLYNDEKGIFERWKPVPLNERVVAKGRPFRRKADGVEYFYFPSPYACIRVKADWKSVQDLSAYEAFTCLKPGAKYDKDNPDFERDASGKLVYGWKRNTGLVSLSEQVELEKAKKLKEDEGWWQCRDVESGKRVLNHGGSVYWNEYRKKWISIFVETFGKPSFLGEIWYAEADAPEGPWKSARKVVTHDNYTFYNPTQHPFFDQDGGKTIYFEGTYTTTFTDNKNPTPRYEYNQVMYRLDLSDPRLKLN